jgi:hypothetical protein
MTGSPSPAGRQFALNQYQVYGVLAHRVRVWRRMLLSAAGADPATLLAAETGSILASPMTREQLASALASLMLRAALGHLDPALLDQEGPLPAPTGADVWTVR